MTEQLSACELCRHWRKDGCNIKRPGFPTIGVDCRFYDREPGVDG